MFEKALTLLYFYVCRIAMNHSLREIWKFTIGYCKWRKQSNQRSTLQWQQKQCQFHKLSKFICIDTLLCIITFDSNSIREKNQHSSVEHFHLFSTIFSILQSYLRVEFYFKEKYNNQREKGFALNNKM